MDENAKKVIENCHTAASSCVKQYLKWTEKDEEVKQKTGILSSLKKALTKSDTHTEKEEVSRKRSHDSHVIRFVVFVV